MRESRVGIVVPSFNSGAMVLEAARSASDSLGSLQNIVIVDDGSTDRASRRALQLLADQGYRVLRQSNAGVSAARNAGIALLEVPYAFVLDADDRIGPHAPRIAADVLDSDDAVVIVAGSGINFTTDGEYSDPIPPGELSRQDMRRWTMIATASAFRVEDWAECGGFPEGVGMGEDWVFWLRLLKQGGTIATSEAEFVQHRIHERQATNGYVDPRESAKSANLVMSENPDLVLAHPTDLLTELAHLRVTMAEYRHAYRHIDRVKLRVKRSLMVLRR